MPKIPSKDPTIFIGVDPGMKGGVAWINLNGETECHKLPGTEEAVWELFGNIPQENRIACIERVWSLQGQGISSAFKFGQAYGFLRACLRGHGIKFYDATPQTWQKDFSLQRPKRFSSGEWKKSLCQTAREWFPDVEFVQEAADSLLIAHHCQLVAEGVFPMPKPRKPKPKRKKAKRRKK